MDALNEPQSSLTCVSSYSPVQLNSIEDLRTWLVQDSHASHSVSQANKLPETTSETCGLQRGMSFASYVQDPFCLKTSKDLFPADISEPSSLTWPSWGMWGNGEFWELIPSEQITGARGSGLLPTPSGTSGNSHVVGRLDEWGGSSNPWRGTEIGKWRCASFEEWMMGWPIGWTALTPLEMDKFQLWLRQHGSF